jgi:hypothetical protein
MTFRSTNCAKVSWRQLAAGNGTGCQLCRASISLSCGANSSRPSDVSEAS